MEKTSNDGISIPIQKKGENYYSNNLEIDLLNPTMQNFSHAHIRLLDDEINAIGIRYDVTTFPPPYAHVICFKTAVNNLNQLKLSNKKIKMERVKVKSLEKILEYFDKLNISLAIADNVINLPQEIDLTCYPFKWKMIQDLKMKVVIPSSGL